MRLAKHRRMSKFCNQKTKMLFVASYMFSCPRYNNDIYGQDKNLRLEMSSFVMLSAIEVYGIDNLLKLLEAMNNDKKSNSDGDEIMEIEI